MKFKAVLFDMDGVIFDTERAIIECWKLVAPEAGLKDIEAFCQDALGTNSQVTHELFVSRYGAEVDYDGLNQKKRELFMRMFDAGLVAVKPGVRELLGYLKDNGVKVALASSTSSKSVLREIIAAGLEKYFDEIVCGDMVTRSKPEPDIWLEALRRLNVEAKDAAAIEDSFNGVRSAKAAGLYTIMVPDIVQPDDEIRALADQVFPSLKEVLESIEKD
ncbi:MAG: HAD family phosphatase [Clostridiales bacterium]|nr:HAD family phosphatase [Clostridiales bacterium]